MAVEHLTGTRGLCLQRIIQWTDGCASQYKSKGPFADISHAFQDYGVAFERHFFGSRHGKGPSDGESAVIKSHAFNATKAGRADIATAEDLYYYCQTSALNKQPHDEDQCHHLLRTFFWVAEGEILRQRGRQVQTLKGTRSLHAVRCVEANTVATRDLSCMCDACLSGIGECSNIESVAPWQNQVLKAVAPAQPAARRQQIQQRVRRQLAVRANRPPAHVVRAAAANRQLFVSDTSDTDSSSPPSLPPPSPEAAADPPDEPQSTMDDVQEPSDTDNIHPLPSPTPAADPPDEPQSPMDVSGVSSPDPRTAPPVDVAQPRKLTVNDCVVVRYPDRKYPGIILECVGTAFKVNFLRPHKTKSATFVYPDPPDVQIVVPEMVIATAIELLPCNSSFREWTVTGFGGPWTN
ncbi:uncharacterized protein [Littorina saxatilis]|uniref:Uncharacterized protein n=1 Tax=Littorina saxatilis TaxID=31220 RepID=A0AAN9G9V1_9CAEN